MKSRLDSATSRLARLQERMEDLIARNSRRRSTDELVAKLHAARARAAEGIFPGTPLRGGVEGASEKVACALGR